MQQYIKNINKRGVTIIELIVTIVVLSAVILSMALLYKEIITGSVKNKVRFEAAQLAEGVSNYMMGKDFNDIGSIGWTKFSDENIGGAILGVPNPFYMEFYPCYEGIPDSDCASQNWTVNPLFGTEPHPGMSYKVDVDCLIPSADIANIDTWDSSTAWTSVYNCTNENYKRITTKVSTPVAGTIAVRTIKVRE